LPRTNTLAYYGNRYFTTVKGFKVQALGEQKSTKKKKDLFIFISLIIHQKNGLKPSDMTYPPSWESEDVFLVVCDPSENEL
jgi:hypothetical protein